mmetsp:Transcript_59779/g.87599  ORF Transcript_59779/g.87599 Transcript_59779/m.87599 type:complete len:255 (-) Transcript_59779:1413-2177(-)
MPPARCSTIRKLATLSSAARPGCRQSFSTILQRYITRKVCSRRQRSFMSRRSNNLMSSPLARRASCRIPTRQKCRRPCAAAQSLWSTIWHVCTSKCTRVHTPSAFIEACSSSAPITLMRTCVSERSRRRVATTKRPRCGTRMRCRCRRFVRMRTLHLQSCMQCSWIWRVRRKSSRRFCRLTARMPTPRSCLAISTSTTRNLKSTRKRTRRWLRAKNTRHCFRARSIGIHTSCTSSTTTCLLPTAALPCSFKRAG